MDKNITTDSEDVTYAEFIRRRIESAFLELAEQEGDEAHPLALFAAQMYMLDAWKQYRCRDGEAMNNITEDDIFHAENDSPADLKVYIGELREALRQARVAASFWAGHYERLQKWQMKAAEVIKETEWNQLAKFDQYCYCDFCGGFKNSGGHLPNCELAALLAEVPNEQK